MTKLFLPKALIPFLVAPIPLGMGALLLGGPPAKGAPAKAVSARSAAVEPGAAAFFTEEVRPVLQENCIACHGGDAPMGGLQLTSRAAILKGGASGPSVSLKTPGESLLLAAVNYQGRQMPPRGKMTPKQIEILTRWVRMGLPWPEGEAADLGKDERHAGPPKVTPRAMKFWSFQPVKRPKTPRVKRQSWVRNPIDAFVLRRLEAAGITPNPPAGKVALLRRVHYDLTGLPPTPEEVRAFLADTSAAAYEKVVDRLLASPRYGEKWGRHWLDLVRYAETNSYERDGHKPNAWRYRDYVIRAFNRDKPYDQFLLEQLAGDELAPRTPEKLIATGYCRLGLWDDEPADPEQALYDDLDDIASTTGQVFLGLTVGCARCHDHKIDPLPQKDYYRFLAFFNGVRRYGVRSADSVAQASLRSIAPEAEQKRYADAASVHKAKEQANGEQIAAIEKKVAGDFTPAEKEEFRTEAARAPILKKRVPGLLSQAEFDRYLALREERKDLERSRPPALDMALCVTEVGATPRPTHVLLRGNPHAAAESVEPGFPSVLAPPAPEIAPPAQGESSGRRLSLARWIASKENPLTARVMANRVWQYHFGRGIVRSPNNFGFGGDKPTHPELLDWLASELVARGWRLKPIHKQIVTSATYRMSARADPKALVRDPENDLFWRFDMRRLQAEEIRDSILAANGSLNLAPGGPSFYPAIPPEVLAGQSRPGEGWGKSSEEEQRRRSVYSYVKRSLITPIIARFDGPETDSTCPARFATTQPTQALGMLNGDFVNEQARVFAAYLREQTGPSPADQVKLALWRTLQRAPTAAEIERGVTLIASLRRSEKISEDGALAYFCVVALNLNEFIYLD